MANSSPPARVRREPQPATASRLSYPWMDDLGLPLEELRLEDRNTEESHQRALEQAKREHAELRQTAIEVLNHYHLQEQQRKVQLQQEQEQARIREEEKLAAEHARLQALKAKTVPIPPLPSPEPAPAQKPAVVSPEATKAQPLTNGATPKPAVTSSSSQSPAASLFGQLSAQPAATTSSLPPKPTPPPNSTAPPLPAAVEPSSKPQPVGAQSQTQNAQAAAPSPPASGKDLANGTSASAATEPAPSAQVAKVDRHLEIHKKLKQLRAFMKQQADASKPLKSKMGDMRREIRKCMGQLIEGTLAQNKIPVQKMTVNLREALHGQVPSQPVDPNEFLLEPRGPVEGAPNNAAQLPSLFIYLLNVLAKAAISQFINECGAKPQAADPIGTVIAKIFSEPEFHWRGASMIDILLAKYRVVCPVLFGFRGSDRTEQGRLRVGWWKSQDGWIPEQIHVDRMTGLGAGFGAISLRDFSRSKNTNPYPPSNYWTTLARIVNTPANEISDTQCYVLKAMIEHYEQKFINSFGSAAVAALRVALVEFPAKAPNKTAAVGALPVLAQILRKDSGLDLS